MPLANTIPQGVTTQINFGLKWDDGTPINLDTITGFVVYLTYINGDPFKKYSLYMTSKVNPDINLSELGYIQMIVVNKKQGLVKIIINSDESQNATLGVVNLTAKLEFPDKDTDSGYYQKALNPIYNFAEVVPYVDNNQITF